MSAKDRQIGGGHYKGRKIQPVEYAMANGLNYCQSLVLRYVTRYKEKDGEKDLRKAIHTIELLIEQEYPAKPKARRRKPSP